jgi:AcrR family transcriptional regulator/DNA-binding MarR family transcriptional regulator
MRIISAMVELESSPGARAATVSQVVGLAGVSRNTFYALFAGCEECLLAAIELAFELSRERASASYDPAAEWEVRMRAGLHALLRFYDEEPQLAQMCVVRSASAGPIALARRWEVLEQLARLIEAGRDQALRSPPPLTADGVVGGALTLIHARILKPGSGPLTELLNPLMAIIVHPYRGCDAAQAQLSHVVEADDPCARARGVLNPLDGLDTRLTYRTMRVLAVIGEDPGLSNAEVSERAGITNQGQISKLLARLMRAGLIENTGEGQPRGSSNAWRLTRRGREVNNAVAREALARP